MPVGAPFVDVGSDAVKTEPIRWPEIHRPRAIEWAAAVVWDPRGQIVAPRVSVALHAAACGAFPLRFGGQPYAAIPRTVGRGVFPADADHRQIGSRERGQRPIAWRLVAGGGHEPFVLRPSDREDSHLELVHVDVMHRRFVVLTIRASHEERSRRNRHEIHQRFAASGSTRRRPYFLTSRSVNPGAIAFRRTRPRADTWG